MKTGFVTISLFLFIAACSGSPEQKEYTKAEQVAITIQNQSGQDVTQICINEHQKIKCSGGLNNNSETVLSIDCPSETSYSLTVVFANGDSLKTLGNYIEPGYNVTETINKDKIETTTNIY